MPFPSPHLLPSFAGIGSRKAPPWALDLGTRTARALGAQGWELRSGGASGMDAAFEAGAQGFAQRIYKPWKGFGTRSAGLIPKDWPTWMKALSIASGHHPAWPHLQAEARLFMGRNVHQVLGDDLKSPVTFVLCWAPTSETDEQGRVLNVTGGTGMAVRLAVAHGIPIYNLDVPEHRFRVEAMVNRWELQGQTEDAPLPRTQAPRL